MASQIQSMPEMSGMYMPPPQPPTPEQMAMLNKPSWEQVIALIKDSSHRDYRIDIETDSTIASSIESDMVGLSQVIQGVTGMLSQVGPAIQSGMMSFDGAKSILKNYVRRARMGLEVEDAIDSMKPPPQQQNPVVQIEQQKAQAEQAKAQMQAQLESQKMQMQAQIAERSKQIDLQIEQQKLAMEAQAESQRQQNDMAVEQHKQEMQARQIQHQNELEAQRDALLANQEIELQKLTMHMDERLEQMRQQFQLMITDRNNAAKIEVAEIAAQTTLDSTQITAANQAEDNFLVGE